MSIDDLRELLKRHRWTVNIQTRPGQGKRFIYAKKRIAGRMKTRYIVAESKLPNMTEAQILAKLVM